MPPGIAVQWKQTLIPFFIFIKFSTVSIISLRPYLSWSTAILEPHCNRLCFFFVQIVLNFLFPSKSLLKIHFFKYHSLRCIEIFQPIRSRFYPILIQVSPDILCSNWFTRFQKFCKTEMYSMFVVMPEGCLHSSRRLHIHMDSVKEILKSAKWKQVSALTNKNFTLKETPLNVLLQSTLIYKRKKKLLTSEAHKNNHIKETSQSNQIMYGNDNAYVAERQKRAMTKSGGMKSVEIHHEKMAKLLLFVALLTLVPTLPSASSISHFNFLLGLHPKSAVFSWACAD